MFILKFSLCLVFTLGASLLLAQESKHSTAPQPNKLNPPIAKHLYTADPSARVFNGKMYVYTSHDEDTATKFTMQDWHVFSSTDMQTFKDEGVIFSLNDIAWANQYAWAPDCIERNGKYFFYYPVEQKHIGVAVGNSPVGPFKDPLQKPLISINSPGVVCNRDFIDPCPFIDTDGQGYLYMGQLLVNAVKLNPDMVSYDGTVHKLEGTPGFFEAIWMHKHKGVYYLSYSSKNGNIEYCTATNPLGPFTHRGLLLGRQNSGTNHHSIVEYQGIWYLFFHNANLYYQNTPNAPKIFGWEQNGGVHTYRRSVTYTKIKYLEDGSMTLAE